MWLVTHPFLGSCLLTGMVKSDIGQTALWLILILWFMKYKQKVHITCWYLSCAALFLNHMWKCISFLMCNLSFYRRDRCTLNNCIVAIHPLATRGSTEPNICKYPKYKTYCSSTLHLKGNSLNFKNQKSLSLKCHFTCTATVKSPVVKKLIWW